MLPETLSPEGHPGHSSGLTGIPSCSPSSFGAKRLRDGLKAAYETAPSKGEGVSNELLKDSWPHPTKRSMHRPPRLCRQALHPEPWSLGCWFVAGTLRKLSIYLPSHSESTEGRKGCNRNCVHLGSSSTLTATSNRRLSAQYLWL